MLNKNIQSNSGLSGLAIDLRILSGNSGAIPNQCIAVNRSTHESKIISSPFVAAIGGMILRSLNYNGIFANCIDKIKSYLNDCRSTIGLVNFYGLHEKYYDLDTTACVSLFLLLENTHLNERLLQEAIFQNRDKLTGGFKTWIMRPNNNIDFMVNINIYLLLHLMGHKDIPLTKFLKSSAQEFFTKGSHYYEDLQFPLFLILFYVEQGLISCDDEVFKLLLYPKGNGTQQVDFYNVHNNLQNIESFKNPSHSQYHPRQYFNSTSETFNSPMLDNIVGAYRHYQLNLSQDVHKVVLNI